MYCPIKGNNVLQHKGGSEWLLLLKRIVLLITLYFPPETNGGATAGWNRAMFLHKMGYVVFVLSGFPAYPSGKVDDSKYNKKYIYAENMEPFIVIRLRLVSVSHTGYIRRLLLFLNFVFLTVLYMPKILRITGKIDMVYSLSPIIFSSFCGFAYSVFTKGLFVYEASDLWPEELLVFRTYLSPLIMSIGKVVAKISYTIPDVIITVSGLAAEYISQEYRPKASVYGIPIGVDPSKFPRLPKSQARDQLIRTKIFPSELENKFIVLYTGLISMAQGIENLVYVADKLRDEKDIAILIVGDGEKKQTIERLKRDYELDKFFVLPAQPRNIIPIIISASDACTVLLSDEPIFDIAVPSKFYEYLACYKPILGVCRGELANIIQSSAIGYTFNPGDFQGFAAVIKQLRNSPYLVNIIEKNCSETLQKYSLENISTKYAHVFNDAFNNT